MGKCAGGTSQEACVSEDWLIFYEDVPNSSKGYRYSLDRQDTRGEVPFVRSNVEVVYRECKSDYSRRMVLERAVDLLNGGSTEKEVLGYIESVRPEVLTGI